MLANRAACAKKVLGRCAFFEDDYFVHVFSPEYHKFDKHTPASYADTRSGNPWETG